MPEERVHLGLARVFVQKLTVSTKSGHAKYSKAAADNMLLIFIIAFLAGIA